MGVFYFVRHGETVWNVENKICGATDSPLIERGHAQARETGRVLKQRIDAGKIHIDEILTSPLSRAYDTAKEISDKIYLLVAHNGIARIVESYFRSMSNEDFAAYGIRNAEVKEYRF